METLIKGRFYFKKTSSGNIIGEFSNETNNIISTESGDMNKKSDNFIGVYDTIWQERSTIHNAKLSISKKENIQDLIFVLKWTRDEKIIFKGEAIMCDSILIGNYESV